MSMPRYLAVIPAAGIGSRVGGACPKQYLAIAGRPLLYYAIARLCAHAAIEKVWVILAPGDSRFPVYDWQAFAGKLEPLFVGGDSRGATVLNALERLSGQIRVDDRVLVHDAARPCLTARMLDRLIDEVGQDASGGLLAVPVADTLKRAGEEGRALRTESRAGLWQAQTPQMFRYDVLLRALRSSDLAQATDESAAVEALGFRPKLIQSDATNLKVTHEQDFALAELILKHCADRI